MTSHHHLQATPDQVLAVIGGLAGGLIVGALWWVAWWVAGSRTTRRLDRAVRHLTREAS